MTVERTTARRLQARADLELRVAGLRATADHMYDVDTSGLLSANLRDFADLLEVLDREGRWEQ